MYRQWKPTVQHNVLYYHFICINFTYLLFLNFHRIYSVLERRHRNVQWKYTNPTIWPCNEFAFPLPIHEGTKLLNEVVKTLGALVEELVDQLARLAKVRQLVEVAVILGVGRGDHLDEERLSKILDIKDHWGDIKYHKGRKISLKLVKKQIGFHSPHPRQRQGQTVFSSPWWLNRDEACGLCRALSANGKV